MVKADELYGKQTRSYQYDSLDNLTYEQTGNNKSVDYKYNVLNQLTAKTVDGKNNYSYTYDKRGNQFSELSEKKNGNSGKGNGNNKNPTKWGETGTYVYDAANRMVQGTNTAGEKSVYTFNGLGQLVQNTWIVENNAYGYHDMNGETDIEHSIKKPEIVVKDFVVDATSPVQAPLTETEQGETGLTYRYTYGLERVSVQIGNVTESAGGLVTDDDTVKLYYHTDRLGTYRYLTDDVKGKVTSWTDYDEWGNITHNAVLKMGKRQLDLVKNYTGHEYDNVLAQYYAKARMYDPQDKRFTAADRVEGIALLPETFNRYVYVKNSPLIYVDPWGYAFYSSTRITQNSGKKNDFASETSQNVLAIQLRLLAEGCLSYSDFSQSFGYVNDSTFNAINKYKEREKLTNSGSSYGVVGATTWKHMGGEIRDGSNSIHSVNQTDEGLIGKALAQYLLDSEAIMQSQSSAPVYVGVNSYYNRWVPAQFTFGAKYYEQLQCAVRAKKVGKFMLLGVDIAETGWNSFNQAAEISGGEPFTTIAGTIVLTGANLIFDTGEPSVSEVLSNIVNRPLDANVQNATNQFVSVYLSDLRYVISADLLYDYMDYYRVRDFTLQRIADAVETLNSVTLNVAPYNEKEVRRSAKYYLTNIMAQNIDYASAKTFETILLS